MKKRVAPILQILLTVLSPILYFIPLFHFHSSSSDAHGTTIVTLIQHSPYEHLLQINGEWFLATSFLIAAISIALSVVCLLKDNNKTMQVISLVVTVVSLLTVAIGVIYASTVAHMTIF